ncbi:hypothetical protein EZJ55_05975 [Microcystis aeruginosa EAWAG127a]|uniref:Uncharacterized protein n=1 Tax=Microcystis aeruginosa EAWAG127a TaxID=2529855 RepID=A0A5J5LR52_MICAE|nr:hypothetical protein [Microcystis aeruginosa]KAB0240204.1 hypothetical protein EZJ55_05975 [Microcystis aeruginosa EAWAG127a]
MLQKFKKRVSKFSLFIILSLFQIVSFSTTLNGTRILLGKLDKLPIGSVELPADLFYGLGIQLFILWLFLFGEHALRSRFTLWLLVLVYTLLSIYTSFFSLYEGIIGKELSPKTAAIEQSDEIVSLIQANKKFKAQNALYSKLEEDIKNAEQASEKYCKTCRDDRKIKLDENTKKLKEEKAGLARIGEFRDYTNNKNKDFKQWTVEKINGANGDIISRFSEEIPQDTQKRLEKQAGTQNFFLLPFVKLLEGDKNAIFAVFIASILDCTSVLIGLNPETIKRDRFRTVINALILVKNKTTLGIRNFLPHLIEVTGHTISTIVRSIAGLPNGIIYGVLAGLQRTFQIFIRTNNTFTIRGRRQDFLENLWDSIDHFRIGSINSQDHQGHVINCKKLMLSSQDNQSFKRGYEKILNRMERLEWVQRIRHSNDTKFEILEYEKFEQWYLKEHNKRFDQERHDMSGVNTFKTVIYLPPISRKKTNKN